MSEDSLHLHPLAYLLGLEGMALLRATSGEHGRDFVLARIEEVRALIADAGIFGDGADVPMVTVPDGYDTWAPEYDEPGNGLIDIEQPIVRDIIDGLRVGLVLDAACGTGRHTEYLVSKGHRVAGVDGSVEMLACAKKKVPEAAISRADLESLPFPDGTFDAVVCALALPHVPDLGAVFEELARVLRPGGHLVTSDAAGLAGGIRPPVLMRCPDGSAGYLPHVNRRTGDYVRAALSAGLEVRRCEEPRLAGPMVDPAVRPTALEMLRHDPADIWWLHCWYPEATNAALKDIPGALIWLFERPER